MVSMFLSSCCFLKSQIHFKHIFEENFEQYGLDFASSGDLASSWKYSSVDLLRFLDSNCVFSVV